MFFLIQKKNAILRKFFIAKQKEEQHFAKQHEPFISLMLPADEHRNKDSSCF